MSTLVEAIDFLFRFPMRKALDPNNAKHFLQISHQLQRAVKGLTQAAEAQALRDALDTLDVDWSSLSDGQRDRVVLAARKALSKPAPFVAPKVEEAFTVFGKKMVRDTKKSADQKYRFGIEADLHEQDHKVVEAVAGSQGNYVRDQYGRWSEDLSNFAKDVVTSGLNQGLGSKDISANLQEQLGEKAEAKSSAYWDMISMTFANRSRSYGNLSGYAAAGIDWFVFEAVMDERTSEVCEMMHGRRFQVARAISQFDKYEASSDPESIADHQPWLNIGTDENGERHIYFRDSDGEKNHVAHINDGADGARFPGAMSDKALERLGISTPPLHGNCRSTILPEE